MNGIQFENKHSYDDWDLILTDKILGLPTPKITNVEIEGSDGVIDTSEVLTGDIKFNNRKLQFEFTMQDDYEDFDERITEIANYLHGRKLKIILDEDDNHYYVGRCSVNQWTSDKRIGKIVISCDCEPYKYTLRPIVVIEAINGTKYVNIYGRRKMACPLINCNNDGMSVYVDNEEIPLFKGNNEIIDLFIHEGKNSIKFKGSGTVKISFVGGDL